MKKHLKKWKEEIQMAGAFAGSLTAILSFTKELLKMFARPEAAKSVPLVSSAPARASDAVALSDTAMHIQPLVYRGSQTIVNPAVDWVLLAFIGVIACGCLYLFFKYLAKVFEKHIGGDHA